MANDYRQLKLVADEEAEYDSQDIKYKAKRPVKIYTKESLIEELRKIKSLGWIPGARHGNAGSVGNTLEDLLGIQENNLPIPNATEWELKCRRAKSNSLVSLFHLDPSPRGMDLITKMLLPKYGWPHKEAGSKYDLGEMSFRQTLNGQTRTDRGFKVVVNRVTKRVEISFDATTVGIRHAKWLKLVKKQAGLGELNPQPYWGFDDLFHKAGTKLHNCFFVQADVKKEADKEFFLYSRILMLQEFSLEGFLTAIESGFVYIDFDARSGHNHGTKFRLREATLPTLYSKATEI